MQQIIYNQLFWANYPIHIEFSVNIWHIGTQENPSFLMGISGKHNGKILFETSCELKSSHQVTAIPNIYSLINQPNPTPASNPIDLDAVMRLVDKAIGLRKEDGVWLPKINQGDTILVDKAGASEVKVLDPAEQAYEKIPKRALTVEKGECSCSMRYILAHGCPRLKGASCVTT